ncbi:MAG: hypothetical protein ABSG57_09085 [Candidatus Bathyarchaeia archaeon]
MSDLTPTIQALQELQKMHQLNLELMEQLSVFAEWVINNHVSIPNKDKLESLLHKTQALMNELYSTHSTKILQYQKLADEKKHLFRTDEEEPVPVARP